MSLPVLLILSFLTVQCDGCDINWEGVRNIKATIEKDPTGFRTAFPKDYNVEHHYKNNMLCDSDPCCVFPAAIVLLDSWKVLLTKLWNKHIKYSFIEDIELSLEGIIRKNKDTERFQEETDISKLPLAVSSPEALLNLTSDLFSFWIKVGCLPSIETCLLPTFDPTFAERVEHPPVRARLLTTRAVSRDEDRREKMLAITQQPSNSGPLSSQTLSFVLNPLFFGLFWGLLP